MSLFDLRRRGKVARLGMAGVNGKKFPAIRESTVSLPSLIQGKALTWLRSGEHLHKNIQQAYNNLDTSFDSFPDNNSVDPDAFKKDRPAQAGRCHYHLHP